VSIEAGMPNYSDYHARLMPITYTSVAAGVWVLTDTKPATGTSSDRDTRPLKPEFAASQVNLALARRRKTGLCPPAWMPPAYRLLLQGGQQVFRCYQIRRIQALYELLEYRR